MICINFLSQKSEDDFKAKLKEIYGDLVYTTAQTVAIPELTTPPSLPVPSLPSIPSPSPSPLPSPSPSPLPSPSPSPLPSPSPSPITPLFTFDFNSKPSGLVTNEFAFWNPTDPKAKLSPDWSMDSGSLFVKDGWGWSGFPDTKPVDALSITGNNSAVFRLTTKRKDFKDVSVKLKLKINVLSSTSSTPQVSWDGIHIFLRYQTEYSLYYASINRRDNTCVIKKKVPGGPSNNGTYYDLTPYVPHKWTPGTIQNIEARVKTLVDGSVSLALLAEGTEIVKVIDNGSKGSPPISLPGATGIRGDNADFIFNNFTVTAI